MTTAVPWPLPRLFLALAAVLAPGALLHALLPPEWHGEATKTAMLVIPTLLLWATGAVSEAVAALLFFAAAVLLGAAPPETIFSGLGSSAFWMIFSGLVIGAAIKHTGLGLRIAGHLAGLARGGSLRVLATAGLFGLLLAFVLPSAMGRVVLIVPLLQDLCTRLGLAPGSRGGRATLLAGILGTTLPSTAILPANIPNNVLASIHEQLFHAPIAYGDYLLQHFPLLGALKAALLLAVLHALYRDFTPVPPAPSVPAPLSAAERRLACYLALAVLLWLSDGIHHIAPAWVGLVVAIACLSPGIGVLPARMLQSVNAEPLLYVSAVIGLGAMISASSLGADLADRLGTAMPFHASGGAVEFLALSGLATAVGLVTTVPGVPAVLTPLTPQFAQLSGLPQELVLASQVLGFSTLLLPYQAPPLIAAMQLASIGRGEMTRAVLALALLSIVVLWPLDYLWLTLIA